MTFPRFQPGALGHHTLPKVQIVFEPNDGLRTPDCLSADYPGLAARFAKQAFQENAKSARRIRGGIFTKFQIWLFANAAAYIASRYFIEKK